MRKKAVIYARFSSDNQREESIDAQIRAINKYAEENNIEIIKTYKDSAFSATTDNRPAFLKMIKESEYLDIDYVIVHKLDRFSRSRYDSAIYKKRLQDNGIRLLSVLEKIGDNPESIIMESLLEGMSEYYSANLSREVCKGMKENALNGKYNGGVRPFGYNIDKEKNYVINELEAEAVRYIYTQYAGGTNLQDICHYLNENGFETTKGKPFKINSLKRILKNKKYVGIYETTIDGERIEIVDGVPSIIEKRLFNKVQSLRKNTSFRSSKSSKNDYLLTGFLYHEGCGLMQGQTTTNRHGTEYSYYFCPDCKERVRTEKIDKPIMELYRNLVINNREKLVEGMYMFFNDRSNYTNIEILENEISDINRQINNTVNAITAMGGNNSLFNKLNELENNKKNLELKLSKENLLFEPLDKDFLYDVIDYNLEISDYEISRLKGIVSFIISNIEYSKTCLTVDLQALDRGLSMSHLVGHSVLHLNSRKVKIKLPISA